MKLVFMKKYILSLEYVPENFEEVKRNGQAIANFKAIQTKESF